MQEVEACCERALIINKGNLVADKMIENLSENLSAKMIELEFSQSIDKEILLAHKAVKSINQLGTSKYEISCSDDIRKEIFQLAVKHSWELLEMKSKNQNLENLFHELTK
jgi:ABC-2 type transport system ATP-binding protein